MQTPRAPHLMPHLTPKVAMRVAVLEDSMPEAVPLSVHLYSSPFSLSYPTNNFATIGVPLDSDSFVYYTGESMHVLCVCLHMPICIPVYCKGEILFPLYHSLPCSLFTSFMIQRYTAQTDLMAAHRPHAIWWLIGRSRLP